SARAGAATECAWASTSSAAVSSPARDRTRPSSSSAVASVAASPVCRASSSASSRAASASGPRSRPAYLARSTRIFARAASPTPGGTRSSAAWRLSSGSGCLPSRARVSSSSAARTGSAGRAVLLEGGGGAAGALLVPSRGPGDLSALPQHAQLGGADPLPRARPLAPEPDHPPQEGQLLGVGEGPAGLGGRAPAADE